MTADVELLPCPFCGAKLHGHEHSFVHPHPSPAHGFCLIAGLSFRRDQLDFWSRRTPDAKDAEIVALREQLEWTVKQNDMLLDEGRELTALAKQPATVDGVLTELVATLAATGTVTGGRIYFPERQTRELLKRAYDTVAKQPAAVDVVKGYPLWQAIHAESAKAGHPCNVGLAQVISALGALAAQHQEPTTCKHDFRRDEDNGGECCQLCGEVKP